MIGIRTIFIETAYFSNDGNNLHPTSNLWEFQLFQVLPNTDILSVYKIRFNLFLFHWFIFYLLFLPCCTGQNFVTPFIRMKKFPSVPRFRGFLSWINIGFHHIFFSTYDHNHIISLLGYFRAVLSWQQYWLEDGQISQVFYSINMVNSFSNVKSTLHSWDKPSWSWCITSLIYWWMSIAKTFFWIVFYLNS